MAYNNILVTGASGNLGRLIAGKLAGRNIYAPPRNEMDITNRESVERYFAGNDINVVIHCAAIARVGPCEKDPNLALETNVIGTYNVAIEAIKKNARIIYISTDYVYPCIKGPYSEKDGTGPFTVYGWTKFAGELSVKKSSNHCIIRTSFFDPNNIPFDDAPNDSYNSKIPIGELADAVIHLLDRDFKGIINVGQERASAYDIYSKYKPGLKAISIKDMHNAGRAVDSSLDISVWKGIKGINHGN